MLHKFKIIDIFMILILNIIIGTLGFKYFEKVKWIDAFTFTCLTMSTIGTNHTFTTIKGKLFVSIFSIYSGLFFIAVFGVILNKFLIEKIKFK